MPFNKLEDFYKEKKISHVKYTTATQEYGRPLATIKDFYDNFISDRLPKQDVVEAWHDLLVRYVEKNNIFFIRKYGGNKLNNKWNNRRGTVTKFQDGMEIVYADNNLARLIYLMAFNDFVPSDQDFKNMIEEKDAKGMRKFRVPSGTEIEKDMRLYEPGARGVTFYLAHIMDVNGKYLRDDRNYIPVDGPECDLMYPLGVRSDWSNQDKVHFLDYSLSSEQKEIVKAHMLRFFDPLNYFPTPKTAHCVQTSGKNIGEDIDIINYVLKEYKDKYRQRYSEFITLARYKDLNVGGTGGNPINLDYDVSRKKSSSGKSGSGGSSGNGKRSRSSPIISEFVDFIVNEDHKEKNTANAYVTYINGVCEDSKITVDGLKNGTNGVSVSALIAKYSVMVPGMSTKDRKKWSNWRSALKKFEEFIKKHP